MNLFYIYRKIIQKIIMECYTCGKKYKSWNGLFYHNKNVHGTDVRSSAFDLKVIKAEERNRTDECVLCSLNFSDLELH